MLPLSNNSGSISSNKTSDETGSIGIGFEIPTKDLIERADTVSLLKLFNVYSIHLDQYNKQITCPFKQHSNGNERTASFHYYSNTNSFYCFGCKRSGGPSYFVHYMEGISPRDAAQKIINTLNPAEYKNPIYNVEEKNNQILLFSSTIRSFIRRNAEDLQAIEYAEKICFIFDTLIQNKNPNLNGIKKIIIRLLKDLEEYRI